MAQTYSYTSPDNIPYPADLEAEADVPTVVTDQAVAVQAGLSARAVNTRSLLAGNGLTGGGTLAADRTFNVGAGTGITVSADSVAVDTNTIATRSYADGKVLNSTSGTSTTVAMSQSASKSYADSKVTNSATGGSTTVAPSQSAIKDYVDGRIWTGTQAAYDAIGTKDPTVLYVITG